MIFIFNTFFLWGGVNRGARETSLVSLKTRTLTTIEHFRKLPTSFEMTAHSWPLSGETQTPTRSTDGPRFQHYSSLHVYILKLTVVVRCLGPSASVETMWSTNLWARAFLTWFTSAPSPTLTWPTPGPRTSVCLWLGRSPLKMERFVTCFCLVFIF